MPTNVLSDIPTGIENIGKVATGVGLASIVGGAICNLHNVLNFGVDVTGIGLITMITGYGLKKLFGMNTSKPPVTA